MAVVRGCVGLPVRGLEAAELPAASGPMAIGARSASVTRTAERVDVIVDNNDGEISLVREGEHLAVSVVSGA